VGHPTLSSLFRQGWLSLDRKTILETVEPILEGELEPRGIEVVDIQYKSQGGRWVLQVFIDTPEGVDLDTCQKASQIIGQVLDREDIIPHSYSLEVSSPGLDRILKKERDFQRFTGRRIKLKASEAIEGRKNFTGVLLGLQGKCIRVDVDGMIIDIPQEKVSQVRLVADI
jgi:ribosome maturation factor RimP